MLSKIFELTYSAIIGYYNSKKKVSYCYIICASDQAEVVKSFHIRAEIRASFLKIKIDSSFKIVIAHLFFGRIKTSRFWQFGNDVEMRSF